MSPRCECEHCGQWCEGAAHIPAGTVVLSAEQVEQVRKRCQLIIDTRADPTFPRSTVDGLTAEQLARFVIDVLDGERP